MRKLIWIAFLVACGGPDNVGDHDNGDIDAVVGASCDTNADCVVECYRDPDRFPGGFCSVPCGSDYDCPADSACASTEDGVCLFTCGPDGGFDCSALGPGWICDQESARDGGDVYVCIGI